MLGNNLRVTTLLLLMTRLGWHLDVLGLAASAPAERVFDADDKDTYIVEKILGERKRKGGKQYQVSWEGYTERTWEPARNLPSAVLRAWRARKQK